MVKSKTRWADMNRKVKDGAPVIWINTPIRMKNYTPEQKAIITKKFFGVA